MGLATIHSRSIRMVFQRRRQKERRWILRVSPAEVISMTAAVLLILLAILAFFGPSLVERTEIHTPGSSTSYIWVITRFIFIIARSKDMVFWRFGFCRF